MKFLQQVAFQIAEKITENSDFCVVCPNKRAIDYLKYEIAQKIGKSIWSPKFLTLSDLIQSYTSFEKTDELILIVELYKCFRKIMNESKFFANYDFEKFYGIGQIILSDFNEIDNYIVNITDIFKNISEFEKINYFEDYLNEEQIETLKDFFKHFSLENISEQKEYFFELWKNIPSIYNEFKTDLYEKNIGYGGMIVKDLCERISRNEVTFDKFQKYIIVGFNALTKAQKNVLLEIQKEGKTEFYWDYDNYYVKNPENEAGLFIRQNLEIFSDDLKTDRDIFLKGKSINLIGFPLEVAQTKAIPTILQNMQINFDDKKQLSDTAIILPDERLLFQLLHAIPPEIKSVNVTLGYPFRQTSVFQFIDSWFRVLLHLHTNKKILAEQIFSFIDNNIFQKVTENFYSKIVNNFSAQKKLFYDLEDIKKVNNQFLNLLFDPQNLSEPEILLENTLLILQQIFFSVSRENRKIESEAVYQFYTQMISMQSLIKQELSEDKEFISIKIFLKFLQQLLAGSHIPFNGKSLDGLQVMTIMETRNIDFENIIILNLNEDILPKKPSRSTLISEFIRKSFGLPVMIYQDSIFAYLFYRTLQNSKNITLTYSNLISNQSGEISRFIQQLLLETNLISKENHKQYTEQIKPKAALPISIEKTQEIYDILSEYLKGEERILSASSINSYLSCELKFYFERIAQIKEPDDEIQKYEIDNIQLGSIFHNTIEELYKPLIDKEINIEDLDNVKNKIDTVLEQKINLEIKNIENAAQKGINKVISQVIKRFVLNTIDYDSQNLPFKILSLEKSERYYGKIPVEIDNKKVDVKIYGIFDRVDFKNDCFKIIDYKTGTVSLKVNKIEKLFKKTEHDTHGFFQMILYCLIYKQIYPDRFVEPHIYSTKKIGSDYNSNLDFDGNIVNSASYEFLSEFEFNLSEVLKEMFDKSRPFSQTEDEKNCTYCTYKGICGK